MEALVTELSQTPLIGQNDELLELEVEMPLLDGQEDGHD